MHPRTLTFEKKARISDILHVGANYKKKNKKIHLHSPHSSTLPHSP